MNPPPAKLACWTAAALAALVLAGAALAWRWLAAARTPAPDVQPAGVASDDGSTEGSPWAGSSSCRSCHESFYQKWSTSHHGLAMQPVTRELVDGRLAPCPSPIPVGSGRFQVEATDDGAALRELAAPDKGTTDKSYPLVHALGGKNVFYFLTPLDRGRLQVAPLAYDIRRREWFDTPASAMRHFTHGEDTPLDWRDPLYTFNTSCHGCHVSQLAVNYDLRRDSYLTTWTEPGINCETCHGPSARHVREYTRAAAGGPAPEELHLISTRVFTPQQHNDSCLTCHAKGAPISASYLPGDRFFDHFTLTTLEHPDYYPDGRDLGENYTATSWRQNACALKGGMDCLHCHTSSGRNRFEGPAANNACLPCHAERVKNAPAHTRHAPDSAGNQCVSCHMPKTEFARMVRSDHSLRPPTPAATLAHGSPNACNVCHKDQDAAWADRHVRTWHKDDYQAPVLHRAGLVAAARKQDWSRLDEMLRLLAGRDRDEIVATSLIRLLDPCGDPRKVPAQVAALDDPSPLVRSAAADGLTGAALPAARDGLLKATRDSYRLVRIRAAAALAALPPEALAALPAADRQALDRALKEYETSLQTRPDDWASHYNRGNLFYGQGDYSRAVAAFETAHKLRDDTVMPLVNAALAHARLQRGDKAEDALRKALTLQPDNPAANFNMGLLRAEQGDAAGAERCLRAAVKADPHMAQAAYNLGSLLAPDRPAEALEWFRKAHQEQPADTRYATVLAEQLAKQGRLDEAAGVLRDFLDRQPAALEAYPLLASLHLQARQPQRAADVLRQALKREEWSTQDRQALQGRLRALTAPAPGRTGGG